MDPWQKKHVQGVLDNDFAVSIYKRPVSEITLDFEGLCNTPKDSLSQMSMTSVQMRNAWKSKSSDR